MATIPRFFKPPDGSFFLFGPRGTGKTTWLHERYPGALFLDLLKPNVYRSFAARPERLSELVDSEDVDFVVLDEVQRVPELLNVVHDLIERRKERRFILTGSSARKLRRRGVDLLAGRAVVRTLHPFMAAELPDFDLERALQDGLLPLVVASSDPRDVLSAYASLYLDQEVQFEGWVRNIGNFARFLEAMSFSHAQPLNLANVARECEVGRRTVSAYLEVLEDLLLSFRLPVFTRRARRDTSAHPKFYYFDAGVFASLRPKGPLDRPHEIAGASLEGLVAQHLRAWAAYSGSDVNLYYWRTRAGSEVDFVVYGGRGFWALEVKNGRDVRREDLRSLKAFREDYPECAPVFLYRGPDRLRIDGIPCIPVDSFLRSLDPSRGILDP
jgi:predicted AAA+ superfamily ATPase